VWVGEGVAEAVFGGVDELADVVGWSELPAAVSFG
jgi:hypothetical protein